MQEKAAAAVSWNVAVLQLRYSDFVRHRHCTHHDDHQQPPPTRRSRRTGADAENERMWRAPKRRVQVQRRRARHTSDPDVESSGRVGTSRASSGLDREVQRTCTV